MSRRFTGVTDINGRKIYTGDTVKMHYFYEAHDYHTLGAYEGEAEVVGVVGRCWGKFYTEQKERHYYNGKLETVHCRYYWNRYLQEPEEELEIIGGLTMTNREWLAQMSDKQFIKWMREYKYKTEMTNTERITNFCIEYFNKHDLDTDDEPITASDIRIMSYADIGVGWSAIVYMPNGYIYEIGTLENIYGAVALNKYRRVGGSLYKWEDD